MLGVNKRMLRVNARHWPYARNTRVARVNGVQLRGRECIIIFFIYFIFYFFIFLFIFFFFEAVTVLLCSTDFIFVTQHVFVTVSLMTRLIPVPFQLRNHCR